MFPQDPCPPLNPEESLNVPSPFHFWLIVDFKSKKNGKESKIKEVEEENVPEMKFKDEE
jgi:hypothetical protein